MSELNISKLPFEQWRSAIERGEVTEEECDRELGLMWACQYFVEAYLRPRSLDETVERRWAKACIRAGWPGLPMPNDFKKRLPERGPAQ
ncbi:MAG: hypothetical protein WAK55_13650 [Xanthobacteraceae bacterium]